MRTSVESTNLEQGNPKKLVLSQEILKNLTDPHLKRGGGNFITRIGPICSSDSFNGCCF